CYEGFRLAAIQHGPCFRGIKDLSIGCAPDGSVQAVAELSLACVSTHAAEGFVIDPGMLDSALQAALNLSAVGKKQYEAFIPFALDQIEVFHSCQPAMWAACRISNQTAAVQKIDIDLSD